MQKTLFKLKGCDALVHQTRASLTFNRNSFEKLTINWNLFDLLQSPGKLVQFEGLHIFWVEKLGDWPKNFIWGQKDGICIQLKVKRSKLGHHIWNLMQLKLLSYHQRLSSKNGRKPSQIKSTVSLAHVKMLAVKV